MFSQSITVSGSVTNEKGKPLIGANIFIDGTSLGSATDVEGNASQQNVSMAVYQAISGSQPVDALAAITQSYTHNADGTVSLNFEFNKEQASQFIADPSISVDMLENIDFAFSYDAASVSNLVVSSPASPTMYFANDLGNGQYEVSQIYFGGVETDGLKPILQLTFNVVDDATAVFTLNSASFNADTVIIDQPVASSVTVNAQEGTDGDDVFELGAGYSNIFTDVGVDTLIVTHETDASVIVDFDPDSDKFDLTQLLNGDESDLGGSFDEETNVLTFSVDDIDVAEVTISDAHEFDEDDLSAVLTDFIA